MAELVYAFDLKSNGEIRAGSIPALGTIPSGMFQKMGNRIFDAIPALGTILVNVLLAIDFVDVVCHNYGVRCFCLHLLKCGEMCLANIIEGRCSDEGHRGH